MKTGRGSTQDWKCSLRRKPTTAYGFPALPYERRQLLALWRMDLLIFELHAKEAVVII